MRTRADAPKPSVGIQSQGIVSFLMIRYFEVGSGRSQGDNNDSTGKLQKLIGPKSVLFGI
ncbi:MAG: hypothetical protein V7L04_07155 [Nostoc sp.]|uniref:hypothetical protein n=1 Tax=Nostoc sp. TaxID=1180 RepID=UPI002FFB2340